MEIEPTKKEKKVLIRDEIHILFRDINKKRLREHSDRVIKNLEKYEPFRKAGLICIYVSMGDEVYTQGLIKKLLKEGGKHVVVPFMAAGKIYLSELQQWNELEERTNGILEPVEKKRRAVDPRSIELFVVPGRAFTRDGYRLGRGGGHYDRLLEHVTTQTIGLAYEYQLRDTLPTEPHDIPLNAIITEKRRYHGR